MDGLSASELRFSFSFLFALLVYAVLLQAFGCLDASEAPMSCIIEGIRRQRPLASMGKSVGAVLSFFFACVALTNSQVFSFQSVDGWMDGRVRG